MDKSAIYDALTALGPWFGAGGLTAIVVAWLGTRKPQPDYQQTSKDPPSPRWFFDGPLVRAIELLDGLYREMKELRREFGESERDTRTRHKEHMDSMRELSERLPRRRN